MLNRRWFLTPKLIQWRYMVACGDYAGPFFSFPNNPSGIDPWEQGRWLRNVVNAICGTPVESAYGYAYEPGNREDSI